jgi:hypothetical protein
MNLQEVTYYLLYVTTVKSVEKILVRLTLKVFIHSLKLKMLLLIHCSQISKTSSSITVVLELKNLVTLLKVVKEDLVVVKEEAIAVAVATEEVLAAAAKEKAMVVVKERVMAVAKEKATVAVILAEAEDVKVEAVLEVSEISLVNHAKAEAEQAKEDADLNYNLDIKLSSPIFRAVFFCCLF